MTGKIGENEYGRRDHFDGRLKIDHIEGNHGGFIKGNVNQLH